VQTRAIHLLPTDGGEWGDGRSGGHHTEPERSMAKKGERPEPEGTRGRGRNGKMRCGLPHIHPQNRRYTSPHFLQIGPF
jgi:hypothetical protein